MIVNPIKKHKRRQVKKQVATGAISALFAGLLGAAGAFFFSPNSGKKNREIAKAKAHKLADKTIQMADDATTELSDSTSKLSHKARKVTKKILSTTEDGAEAVKEKAKTDKRKL